MNERKSFLLKILEPLRRSRLQCRAYRQRLHQIAFAGLEAECAFRLRNGCLRVGSLRYGVFVECRFSGEAKAQIVTYYQGNRDLQSRTLLRSALYTWRHGGCNG